MKGEMFSSEHTSEAHRVDGCVHQGIGLVGMESIANVHRLAIDVDDVDDALPVTARRPLPGVRNISRLWVRDRIKHRLSLHTERDDNKTICSSKSTLCGVVTRIQPN